MKEMETISDPPDEDFYQKLVYRRAFEGFKSSRKEADHCILFCKKVAPHVFNIHKGVAVVNESMLNFTDGICLIAPSTKVVLVIEEAKKK